MNKEANKNKANKLANKKHKELISRLNSIENQQVTTQKELGFATFSDLKEAVCFDKELMRLGLISQTDYLNNSRKGGVE